MVRDTRHAPPPTILTSAVPNALGESMCPTMFEDSVQPKQLISCSRIGLHNLLSTKLLLVLVSKKFVTAVAYYFCQNIIATMYMY